MAQYRTTIKGQRGEASRLGSKNSGMTAHVNGWNIGASVWLPWDEVKKEDRIRIELTSGSGYGPSKTVLYLNEEQV